MNRLRAYLVQIWDALLAHRPDASGAIAPQIPAGLESCLTHTFLLQAADRQVPLDGIKVDVMDRPSRRVDGRGVEATSVSLPDIQYTVQINSPASDAQLTELHAAVEEACTALSQAKLSRPLSGSIVRTAGLMVNSVTVPARAPALV